MSQSKYTFERTELRTLQNMCEGDNEKFLNMLADIVGWQNNKLIQLESKVEILERTVVYGGRSGC